MEEVTVSSRCFCLGSRRWQPQQTPSERGGGPRNGPPQKTKPINPVLASIVLAVQRTYGTVDNTYTLTLVFLMLTWTLHMMSMFECASDNLERCCGRVLRKHFVFSTFVAYMMHVRGH
jgi:hypothetical protein